MSQSIPRHMRAEWRRWITWNAGFGAFFMLLWLLSVHTLPLLLWLAHQPFSLQTLQGIAAWGAASLRDPVGTGVGALYRQAGTPFAPASTVHTTFIIFGGLVAAGVCSGVARAANPFRGALMIHGDARFADAHDIAAMDAKDQVGPSGNLLHLGYFGRRPLGLIEPLSSLVLAPPGTGKTAGFVIPSILRSDSSCFIIHDPKPELWPITSGHRAGLGPTFRLDWSKTDNTEKREFHPKFNFLDPRIVPDDMPARDTFVDSLSKTLIPEKSQDSNSYFTERGRASLTGFTHFLISKVNVHRDYTHIPARWRGKNASYSMMVDWLNETQNVTSSQAAEQGQGSDPMRTYMQELINEARHRNYAPRAISELQPLVLMADKERSGVLNTMEAALLSFKNQAVVERTTASDFIPSDLRGMLSPAALERLGCERYPTSRDDWNRIADRLRPADWQPVTVMVCINQADAPAFSSITTLFMEVCSKELLAYGPGERTAKGAVLGPFPTCFMIDEFARLSKSDAVMKGPELGRSKKTYYCLIAQDIDQIEQIYSKQDRAAITSTTAIKYILPQNSPATIKEIAEMVGKTTVKRKSISRQTGLKGGSFFGGNLSESLEGVNLLNSDSLSRMPDSTHLLIVQGFLARPVQCRTPRYWEDRFVAKRALNPRTGVGPPASTPLPANLHDQRVAEADEDERRHKYNSRRLKLRTVGFLDLAALDDYTRSP